MTNHLCSIPSRHLLYAAFLQKKQHFKLKNLASFFLILSFFLVVGQDMAWGQLADAGVYPSQTTVTMGKNISITPDNAPNDAGKTTASCANTNFRGLLTVVQSTGVVRVTNAQQAGTYTIKVKNVVEDYDFNNDPPTPISVADSTTFTLTITNPTASSGEVTKNPTDVSVGGFAYAVAIGDFNGDGNQDLAVANNQASTVSIRLGDGQGGFSGTTDVSPGTSPAAIAIGDFNEDGNQDLAVCNAPGSGVGTVSIRLGDGQGGFSGTTAVSVGAYPTAVAIGDFNEDGHQDLATTNYSESPVSIRLGDGQGGFSGTTTVSVGSGPNGVAIGDFNRDGYQDLAVSNSSSVSIRLGDGMGGFSGTIDVSVGDSPIGVAIGDFNGDGYQDFAVANKISSGTVSIRLGDGMGGFSSATAVSVGAQPNGVAIGDFNGDGKQDLAVSNSQGSTVSIRLGIGDGTFSGITDVSATSNTVAIGDFNGDGYQDLAVSNFTSGTVSILLGDGMGGFSGTTAVSAGVQSKTVAIGDFNGDGKQDLATISGSSVSILLGSGGPAPVINVQGNGTDIADGDTSPSTEDDTDFGNGIDPITRTFTIQNTGDGELTISSIGSSNTRFLISGAPNSVAASSSATFDVAFEPFPGDVVENATITINSNDADKAMYDFVVKWSLPAPTLGNYAATSVTAGKNTSVTPSSVPSNANTISVSCTNTNFRGLLTVDQLNGVVRVTNAQQAGTYTITVKAFGTDTTTATFTLTVTDPACSQAGFESKTAVSVGDSPQAVAIGDFNEDGRQDLAVVSRGSSTVSIRLDDGQGGFSSTTDVSVSPGASSVAIGDFNGDGHQDLAVPCGIGVVSIRLGDGMGGFSGTTALSVGSDPRSVAIGDFNGDGHQDLAVVNRSSDTVSILLGDGQGGFSGTTDVSVGDSPNGIAIGDFDRDGNQDFVVLNYDLGTASIRLGNGNGGFSGTTVVPVGLMNGFNPAAVAIGDFNGDGNQDLAVAISSGFSSVSIRLGDGNGDFTGTTEVSAGVNNPRLLALAIGDFNGDGKQDLAVVVSPYSGVGTVSIRLGIGDGTFSGTTDVSVGERPISVAIGDFNGDGKQDLAAANESSDNVSILLGGTAEINVQGNNTDIADGDTSASIADYTEFGAASTRTFTIQNTGNAALTISSIVSSDPAFVVSGAPSSVAAGSSASFDVAFTSNGDPVQNATITINSDDCNKGVYDFVVKWSLLVPCNSVLSSLNVTLDGNGQFSLTPETVATGPCSYSLFRVVVQDNNQSNGGTIDCAGTWTYGLFDADGHLVAWGKVTAEDKTAPALIDTDFYTGTLDCYDVNYVLNNPMTIGNVLDGQTNLTNSPKPAATSTQTILYAEGPTAPENTTDDKIYNLGYPNFQDNCRDCGCRTTLKWSDKVVYYGCDSISATGIYARIFREWVATDCNGMRSSVVQVIPFARPAAVLADPCAAKPSVTKQLVFRGTNGKCGADANVAAPNYDWVVQYTSCTPDKSLIQKVDVMPSFRSFFYNSTTKRDIYLDEAECNYSVQIKDTEFPTCGGKGLKIDREIYVFDWCAGGVIDTLHVLIKITDDKAPTLTAPAFVNGAPYRNPAQTPTVEISTGPMDCTAAIPTTVAGIKKTFGYTIADNCTLGNVTMSVKTKDRYVKGILVAENTWDKVDYAIMNNSMIGLPTGYHRLIVDMSDGCYNAKRDSFEFYVYDGIAPVMKCDDQLNVSLSNGNGYTTGYAQVRVEDLNEGSWDNCKIDWIKARRNVPAALVASFIAKGYDSNNNGKLDAAVGNDINGDGDYNDVINGVEEELKDGADGIDINGDGDFADFGETFVLKGGKLMTPLTDVVEFFCGDVAAKVTVELWGQDIEGNRSFCWEEILIEDKVAPACVAPFDITVDCDEKCLEKIDNKAVSALCFGDVTITSGNDCAALDTVYSVSKDLKCGYGTIVRSWALTKQTAKGPITINCAQTITVRAIHQYNICFPKDASADCKTPIIDTIITDELSCDILSVNVSDKRYDASDDECYKIFRTYSVINWCTYDDVCGDPLDQTNAIVIDRGYFGNYGKAPLYLLVRDSDRDLNEEFYISENLTPNEADDLHFYADNDINGDTDDNGYNSSANDKFVPYCQEVEEYKHSFIYTQIIKVYDDVRPVVTGDAAKFCIRDGGDCLANLKMVINGKDNCSDKVTLETNVLMIAPYQTLDASKMIMYSSPKWSTKDLGNGDFEINVKDLAPLGTHDLIVVVRDECGNLSVPTRIPFTIADCKGPAPICINGLSTDLMSDGNGAGMMAVWASDFVASKIYDCNGQDASKGDPSGRPLITKYSLNRVGDKKDKNVTGINLTCADKGKVILVELHAWDEVGNDDFCVTYVEVQDNRNVCPGSTTGGSFNIAGTISTEGTANLQGAAITLSGQTSMSATTTANGAYSFVNLAKGGDFTIAPQLDKNHLNGVSTFDLVLIQKHILGVVALNSPYKMIAADVNNSKSITTQDLIALRKLILNIDQSFQNNTSWRFVDATYKFPNASNPWAAAFPEVVSVNDLAANTTANFVAIKVGDVNASATVSSATTAEVRTNGTLEINAADAALKAGQEYSVEFSAADLKNVQGYQFALNLDKRKVELVDIVYGVAKAENFGVFASEGIITTSWNSEVKQGALFTLVLRAKADAQLSSALSLNRIVAAEAYNSNNDQLDLALTFNKAAVNNGFELKQNTPNPFNGETVINFNLPKATAATLTISDVTGRILKSVRANYAKGLNQVTLRASDLNASGVLYYTLEADDFTATKKMIVVSE